MTENDIVLELAVSAKQRNRLAFFVFALLSIPVLTNFNLSNFYKLGFVLLNWVVVCTIHRYELRNQILIFATNAKSKSSNTSLDLSTASDIGRIIDTLDFPFLRTKSLELGLFKTYGSPSTSKLLCSTKEMTDRCPQRYDDTDILIREITENKLDSERAQKAIQRMNAIHNHYVISNEDYLYDLGIFMCSPVEMIEKFGYRKLESVEIEAHYVKWAEIGRKMNIKDIPESFVAMQQFMKNFEKKHFKFSEHNKSVATATSNLFLSNFPEFLHPLGLQLTSAICTPLMRESLGLEEPVYGMVHLVGVLLKGFGFFNRYFVLPRSELLRRTPIDGVAKDSLKCVFHPYYATYKDGYVIGELGPNKFKSL